MRNKWICLFLFRDWFPMKFVSLQYFCGVVRNKLQTLNIKRRSKEDVKFWPMKNISQKLQANENLIMSCLQIYRELLSLATFLRVYPNTKEVSYLSWQNAYPNLKTTCHIMLKCLLWTKLLENLLLAKYLISVTAPLS